MPDLSAYTSFCVYTYSNTYSAYAYTYSAYTSTYSAYTSTYSAYTSLATSWNHSMDVLTIAFFVQGYVTVVS